MKKISKELLLRAAAVILAVLPTAVCVLSYFPLWKRDGATELISGFTLILLLVAYAPIFKLFKRLMETPAAVWGSWLIIFVLFLLLSRIADEMCVIGFVGFITNLSSAFLWKLSDFLKSRRENKSE